MKEKTTISISKKLKEKAKNENINLSQTLEDSLTEQLDYIEQDQIHMINLKLKQNYEQITEIEEEIHHLQFLKNKLKPKNETQQKEQIWDETRNEIYRRLKGITTEQLPEELISEAEDILGYSFKELMVIVAWFKNEYHGNHMWRYVEPAYLENHGYYSLENSKYLLKDLEECIP